TWSPRRWWRTESRTPTGSWPRTADDCVVDSAVRVEAGWGGWRTMTWLELALAGLDETRRITVRAFMQELGGQPRDAWRSRLREMTGDAETIALVETLLEQGAVAPSVRPATELEPGDVVGNWRLQERLASGGMGTV